MYAWKIGVPSDLNSVIAPSEPQLTRAFPLGSSWVLP